MDKGRDMKKSELAVIVMLVFCAARPVAAQLAPGVTGAAVTGTLALGRSVFALPPGDWQLIPVEDALTTVAGEAVRRPVARAILVQVDAPAHRLRAASYFMATGVTAANISSWNTSVCQEPALPLHRDMLDGSFDFPACLVTDYWIVGANRPTGLVGARLWDWLKANEIEIPSALLWSRYVKYRGGDFVFAVHYVNPEAFGIPPSVERSRYKSEWNASSLKGDALRSAYLERFKKWGYVMATSYRATLLDGGAKERGLPAFP